MNQRTLEILEYQKILQAVSVGCMSAAARDQILLSKPLPDVDLVRRELKRTDEAFLILFEYCDHPVTNFDAVGEYLIKIEKGGVLEIKQLLQIMRLLVLSDHLQDALLKYDDERIVELQRIASMFGHAPSLLERLQRSILSEDELADEASVKLATVREQIRQAQNKIKDKLRHYVTGTQYSTVLQDKIVTVRDGRYVLPVRAEYKSSINGIVHDTSDSGATCYIEPMAIFELNNKLREAEAAEHEEVARILTELSREVAVYKDVIANNETYYIKVDAIFARATYAERVKGVCPEMTEERRFLIKAARHPLLDEKKVVPTNVAIENGKRILIISGPNTGGKTVVLKTMGLFCAMAYSGLFLPCEEVVIPYFDRLYCDIGDNQSIAESLSTFSSHIKNISEILSDATENSLVLLDELGAGTDPIEGAALAVAVTKALVKRDVFAVVTTHYSEMKEFGLVSVQVENASMEFNPETLLPTYRLKMGLPGVSNALGIAAMLGLDSKILEDAKAYIGEGKRTFESVLAMADAARTQALDEREALNLERKQVQFEIAELNREREAVDQQYEKLNNSAKNEVAKIVEKYVDQAQEIIEHMTELEKDVNAENLLKAKQLRSALSGIEKPIAREENFDPVDAASLKIGEDVILKSLGSAAKIKSLPDRQGKLDVTVGNMVVKVKTADLARRKFLQPKAAEKQKTVRYASVTGGLGMSEVNLLGKTVDEAIPMVDALIDSAILHSLPQVKIIHGNGTGALRKGILMHLKNHRHVEEYRQGAYGEGGYGVTIVTVR